MDGLADRREQIVGYLQSIELTSPHGTATNAFHDQGVASANNNRRARVPGATGTGRSGNTVK